MLHIVQPVPAPSTKVEDINKNKEGGNNQKLKLFKRGTAISGTPIIIEINQLPKAPIKIGITIKKIILKACAVTITLYNWWFPCKICAPGKFNSSLIRSDRNNYKIPEQKPKNKYIDPIYL